MIVSRQSKFIFLSNPKCATTTIRKLLRDRCEITAGSLIRGAKEENARKFLSQKAVNLLHISAHQLRKSFNRSKERGQQAEEASLLNWEDYYVFGTIRNPFKKFVSWYFAAAPDKNFKTPMNVDEYDETTSFHHHFNDFVDYGIHNDLAPPAYKSFCCDPDTDEQLLTDVFKLEEIDDVFQSKFKEKTGISLPTPLSNSSVSKGVRFNGDPYELYNQKSIDLINEVYKSDIETFNYAFGQ